MVGCADKTQTAADNYALSTTTSLTSPTPLVAPVRPLPTTATTTTTTSIALSTTTPVEAELGVTGASSLSDEALLLASYTLGQRGGEVVELQRILGVTTDGLYWTQTQAAHLELLTRQTLPTVGVPALPVAVSGGFVEPSMDAQEACRAHAFSFLNDSLSPWGVPAPRLVFDETIKVPYYLTGQGAVVAKSCTGDTSLAHELGHYVLDLANGYDWPAHAGEAAAKFASGSWIKGAEASPGVEYAAHCIGWVLYGEGTYTRCPNDDMRAYARSVLARAGS